MHKNNLVPFSILFLFLVGCINNFIREGSQEIDSAFITRFGNVDFSNQINLSPVDNPNAIFYANNEIRLMLNNTTRDEILLILDKDIQIFTLLNNDWVQIKNLSTYMIQPALFYVSPKEGRTIVFSPNLEEYREPIELRIVVVASITKNNPVTSKRVGAYFDITVQPMRNDNNFFPPQHSP